jgi:RHS repeat-associated protein
LTSLRDLTGQGIDVERDQADRIQFLRQSREGRGYRLVYNREGRVTEVYLTIPGSQPPVGGRQTAPRERLLLRYGYNQDGCLAEFVDPLGNRGSYAYDDAGRLKHEVTLGGMFYRFRYDARGRCVESTGQDDLGRTELEFDDVARVTRVTNSLDQTTIYHWNANGQVERQVSPLGNVTATVYDEHGRVFQEIGPTGATTSYEYDSQGDRVKLTLPTGAEWHYEFDAEHRLVCTIDPAGHPWRRTYGPRGLASETDPLGATRVYFYNELGDLIRVQDPAGHKRDFQWDEAGNVARASDWRGHWTAYEYNDEGQLTSVVDPLGNRTNATYDARGRVTAVRYPDGAMRQYAWNAYDQVTESVNEAGAAVRRRFTACGLVAEVVRPDGGRIQFEWSTEPGWMLAVRNEHGERHRFEYDADGRLVQETDFAGRTTRYEYGQDEQITAMEDALGQRTQFVYDAAQRLIEVVRHDGARITGEYDVRGILVKADNGECAVERGYDAAGQLVWEKQGRHTVRFEYDPSGNRVRRDSSEGAEVKYQWDGNSQLTQLSAAGVEPIHFEYDACLNEVARSIRSGVRIARSYDGRRRCVEQRVIPGTARSWTVGGNQPIHRSYDYAGGRLRGLRDDCLGGTSYAYDSLGHVTAAEMSGLSEQFAYDSTDNVEVLARRFANIEPGPATKEQRCRYGPGNLLEQCDGVQYQYDALGRLVRKTDARGTVVYRWNSDGRLASVQRGDAEWKYKYDPFGRRVEKCGPGLRTEFVWDDDVILHELRCKDTPEAEVVQWEFEPNSFTPITKTEGGQQYLCVNDVVGVPLEVVTGDGTTVRSAQFTTFGELRRVLVDETDCPVRYQGQWFDEETGLHYNRFRYYDPAGGRYISPDPLGLTGGLNSYIPGPNTTGWIDPYGLTSSCPSWNEFQKRNKGKFRSRQEAARAWRSYQEANLSTNNLSIGRQADTARAAANGRQILNVVPATDWTLHVNDAWVQGGIDRRATFRLESPPTAANRSHPLYPQSVFGRELSQLEGQGYTRRSPRSIFMDPP